MPTIDVARRRAAICNVERGASVVSYGETHDREGATGQLADVAAIRVHRIQVGPVICLTQEEELRVAGPGDIRVAALRRKEARDV